METSNINTSNLNELEEMQVQYNQLKKRLESQSIITDQLLRQTMRSKMSWISRYTKFQAFAIMPIIILLFLFFKFHFDLSWAVTLTIIILSLIDVIIDIKINKISETDWLNGNLLETKTRLLKMKKIRTKIFIIEIPILIAITAWFILEMLIGNTTEHIGGMVGAGIGVLIGIGIAYKILRRMQKTNDELINQITDYTKEN